MIVFKHIEEGLPQKGQVIFRKTGNLARQVGRDIAFTAVEAIGNDVFPAHFGALLFSVGLRSDGYPGDCDLLGNHRLHAAGKAQLNRPSHLTAIERSLNKGSHHCTKGADVIKVGAHPVPYLPIKLGVLLLFLFHCFLCNLQFCISLPVTAVEGHAVFDVNAVAGSILLHRLHIVANLPFEAYVGHDAKTCFRIYARHVASVRVAIGISVFHIEENDKLITVFDGFRHFSYPPSFHNEPGSDDSSPTGKSPAEAGSSVRGILLPVWREDRSTVYHNRFADRHPVF